MRLVDLEMAEKLKRLGYDGEYHQRFVFSEREDKGTDIILDGILLEGGTTLPRPTYDDVMYWLIERHRIFVQIVYRIAKCRNRVAKGFQYSIRRLDEKTPKENSFSLSQAYEDALERGIRYALTLI